MTMTIVCERQPVLISDMSPEEKKREIARLDYQALIADAADRLKHQVDLAQATIRSLTLINGGAIVALFTFIGNLDANGALLVDPPQIKRAFLAFAFGLMFAMASSFGAFLSQYWYALTSQIEAWHRQAAIFDQTSDRDLSDPVRRGSLALAVAVASSIASLICFGIGSWLSLLGVLDAG